MSNDEKFHVLIVDDSEMNRSILADILDEKYEIIEAEDGLQAVRAIQEYGNKISVVLLDMVMPKMDGFGVLEMMKQQGWIEDVPVIMISAESSSSYVERAYDMGVTDFISRPFDALIVRRRVINTILLYAKQKKLTNLLTEQLIEKEQNSNLMVDILSHIVEFRNGESGLHVLHVRLLTELLLNHLQQMTSAYGEFSHSEVSMISLASALHDIGKISIDEKILNKPGRLTNEEFEIMKTHTLIGAKMLADMTQYNYDPLVKIAYDICRWHHERWDGSGYPDGVQGNVIPIYVQVVSMADVYDALTSERVYKKAFSHETAVSMILEGQCGVFNPDLLRCLQEVAGEIRNVLQGDQVSQNHKRELQNVAEEMLLHDELNASERTLRLLEKEREKYNFFASLTQEIQFEYTSSPPTLILTPIGAQTLGVAEIISDPRNDASVTDIIAGANWDRIAESLRNTTPEKPVVSYDCKLQYNGELRWHHIIARAMWQNDEPPVFSGAIGKVLDIHDSRQRLAELERKATHDALTGLLNHDSARKLITEQLEGNPRNCYALIIFDLDHFKKANDTYGHIFGDRVLQQVAQRLRDSLREKDIAARVGGDEFLIFLQYTSDIEPVIQRIFNALICNFEGFNITVSMGIACTSLLGNDYETLFHAADQALYTVKRGGRGQYHFYDGSMTQTLSSITNIESDSVKKHEPGHDNQHN